MPERQASSVLKPPSALLYDVLIRYLTRLMNWYGQYVMQKTCSCTIQKAEYLLKETGIQKQQQLDIGGKQVIAEYSQVAAFLVGKQHWNFLTANHLLEKELGG